MFKPVHTVQGGSLQSDIVSSDMFAVFDTDTYMALVYAIGAVDHTYVKLGTGRIAEVVKVSNPVSGLTEMVRGKDGTSARPWPAGTPVEYIFCSDAVTDMIAENPLPTAITLTSNSGTVIINDMGNYTYDLTVLGTKVEAYDNTIEVISSEEGYDEVYRILVNKAALLGCPAIQQPEGE